MESVCSAGGGQRAGQDGYSERRRHLASRVEQRRGAASRGRTHVGERGSLQRQERQAKRQAAGVQHAANPPQVGAQIGWHQQRRGEGGTGQPNADQRPRTAARVQPGGQWHDRDQSERLENRGQPRFERRQAAQLLQVERHQEQRANQTGRSQQLGGVRHGEHPILEQPEIEHRLEAVALDGDQGQRGEGSSRATPQHDRRGPAVDRHPRQAVQGQRQAEAGQTEAAAVEAAGVCLALLAQHQRGKDESDQSDRQIDVKDPAPAGAVDQPPADKRPDDGRQDGGYADDRHASGALLDRERAHQHGRADGYQHAATHALHHAERDQRGGTPGHPAQRRTKYEDAQREQERSLGAEPVADPTGGRNPDRQAEQVAGHYPFEHVVADAQLAPECWQRHVDNGGVEDIGEQRHDKDGRDQVTVGDACPEPVGTQHLASLGGELECVCEQADTPTVGSLTVE